MRKYNILVTGVGAIIGYGVISSLRKSKYQCNIIGMDIYSDAVGQVWCDHFLQAIPAADENYINFLNETIDKYHIDLVFFGTEQEIQRCYECRVELQKNYSKLVLNRDNIIPIAGDKWKTHCFLTEHGIKSIPSSIYYDFDEAKEEFGLPLLLKPRRSYASKGICLAYTKEEFDAWRTKYSDQFMVQKMVGDDEHEYTAATFGLRNGRCIHPIVMRRKLSKAGATDKAIVYPVPEIDSQIYRLCESLKPIGPINFQFRLHDGDFLLLEINPRISASTSIRTAFGYNEAEMCIGFFLEGVLPPEPIIRTGRAYRYITEAVEYESSGDI